MTTHPCKARGCAEPVAMDKLVCPAHWKLVPTALQRELYHQFRKGALSEGHVKAMDACIDAIAEAEGRE